MKPYFSTFTPSPGATRGPNNTWNFEPAIFTLWSGLPPVHAARHGHGLPGPARHPINGGPITLGGTYEPSRPLGPAQSPGATGGRSTLPYDPYPARVRDPYAPPRVHQPGVDPFAAGRRIDPIWQRMHGRAPAAPVNPSRRPVSGTDAWSAIAGRVAAAPDALQQALEGLRKAEDERRRIFSVITGKRFGRNDAPAVLYLPDVFGQAAREMMAAPQIGEKGLFIEHSSFIGLDSGQLKILFRRRGQEGQVPIDMPLGAGDVLLARIHTHSGRSGVVPSDTDMANLARPDAPRMIGNVVGGSLTVVLRTQEFDGVRLVYRADRKDLMREIGRTYDATWAASTAGLASPTPADFDRATEAAVIAVSRQYGLVYYRGTAGGALTRIEPSR